MPGIPLFLTIWEASRGPTPLVLIVIGYGTFLSIQIGVEILTRKNHAPGARQRVPLRSLIPVWLYMALAASMCAALATAAILIRTATEIPSVFFPWFGAALLLAALAAIGAWATLTRPQPSHTDRVQDRLLRAVTMHRIVRSLTSAMLMLTAFLISAHALMLSTAFGVYSPPSNGIAPSIATAVAAIIAVALIIVTLPGPVRSPEAPRVPAVKALYP